MTHCQSRCNTTTQAVAALALGVALMLGTLPMSAWGHEWDPSPRIDPDEGSDETFRPIVFVHGQNGAGEQFERQAMHFASNGYPVTWLYAFDYNTAQRGEDTASKLDAFIDQVRERTGFDKVDLIGHSRGTFESQTYLTSDPGRAAKVAHYANVAGRPATIVGGVPTLVVGSPGDAIAGAGRASEGAEHAVIPDKDHVEVMTCAATFAALFRFFNDKEPTTLDWVRQEEILIGGYAETYITNFPAKGAKIEVWEVARESGQREKAKPLVTFTASDRGKWGPFRAEPGQRYEFAVEHETYTGTKHFYREPFTRHDLLVYFRLASSHESARPSPLDTAPEYLTDGATILNIRHQNGAIFPRKHSLRINDREVASEATTPEGSTPVGIYVLDANKNGETDITGADEPPWRGAFIATIDMVLAADPKGHVSVELDGHTLNVPTLPASEAGQIYVVFD